MTLGGRPGWRRIGAAAFGALAMLGLTGAGQGLARRHAAGMLGAPDELHYGAWGFDSAGEDQATRPGDSFFEFANGGWLAKAEIPADKPGASLRLAMTDRIEANVHGLLEDAAAHAGDEPSTPEGKVGAFYKAFMDEGRIESLGAAPIAPHLAAIRQARSRPDLGALMGQANSDLYGSLFQAVIDVDPKTPGRYAVFVDQAGLGLPDRDYYLQPQFAAQKAAYQAYVARLLTLAGWPGAQARAAEIVALETRIAQVSWSKAQQRDPDKVYNPMPIGRLEGLAGGFPWKAWLRAGGVDGGVGGKVIVGEPTAFRQLALIWSQTPVDTLKAWMAFQVADNAASYLSSPFQAASFEFRDKALSGQAEPRARWKRAVRAVGGGDYGAGERLDRFGDMGWAVGQLYVEHYFPPSAKAAIESLVGDLKSAFRARLQALDWMSPATKAEALRKLDTYVVKVGYPDHARDYSGLRIRDDDLLGDVRRAAAWDWAFQTGRRKGPVDRADWQMTPQTNDAYNGALRDIVFPAGILQAPIFDASADPAINYGAIGAVIGHEMTHGFDDQGRKFDAAGRQRDWWTKADADAFQARAARLGAQYSAFEPLSGAHVNGDLTMGENIADLGGLTLALDAYHASLKGRPAPVIDGMTGDQRVFLGWAQAWRGKAREDALRRQLVSDPHSPRQYRVDGVVRNLDAWYAAFDVKPGDKLYLPPDRRVRIW
ncbi:M13 family metallopeptidase [Caulobacter sp. KR2-114]|uniref:M13 family metallopeptidase n=1 Tax=Caulobacter sp. KR2-114 TaxID=3400912 RepID=UPI003C0D40B9